MMVTPSAVRTSSMRSDAPLASRRPATTVSNGAPSHERDAGRHRCVLDLLLATEAEHHLRAPPGRLEDEPGAQLVVELDGGDPDVRVGVAPDEQDLRGGASGKTSGCIARGVQDREPVAGQ